MAHEKAEAILTAAFEKQMQELGCTNFRFTPEMKKMFGPLLVNMTKKMIQEGRIK